MSAAGSRCVRPGTPAHPSPPAAPRLPSAALPPADGPHTRARPSVFLAIADRPEPPGLATASFMPGRLGCPGRWAAPALAVYPSLSSGAVMKPVKSQGDDGHSIRLGISDTATGRNRCDPRSFWSAGRRRNRRRPATGLLADVLARRLDGVHVELFVLDLDGFHAVRSDYRPRAEVACRRQPAGVALPVDRIG